MGDLPDGDHRSAASHRIGPLYQAKTLNVCAPEDFVCSDGMDFAAHNPTTYTGPLTDQGAAFAASHLSRTA